MHIALFIKVIYWIQILLKKNIYIFYTVLLQSYFFDGQSKFLMAALFSSAIRSITASVQHKRSSMELVLHVSFSSRFSRAHGRCYTSRSTSFEPPHVFPTHVDRTQLWFDHFLFWRVSTNFNCVRSTCVGKIWGESNVVDNWWIEDGCVATPLCTLKRALKEGRRTSSVEDRLC